MIFSRKSYLDQLTGKPKGSMIKIITGLRRSGKSFFLFKLFKQYLLQNGVDEEHIIEIILDDRLYLEMRNPDKCLAYIRSRIQDKEWYYLLIDEVQLMSDFVDVLNSCLHISNLDVNVTGSNSRFLVSDVATEFRGRGDEIRLYPLSFSEYAEAFPNKSWDELWEEYALYGGLPLVASEPSIKTKRSYLKQLFAATYLKDVVDRYGIKNTAAMNTIVDIISSSIGSLTNPNKLQDTFKTVSKESLSAVTISQYLDYLEDAFLISRAQRYDVKGRKYIGSPFKYYFTDMGLRNARLNFRQIEDTHIMENVIYNELLKRGCEVDVGVIEVVEKNDQGKPVHKRIEIDFVVNYGYERYYIQSALTLPTTEKRRQEERPLLRVGDGFKKIIITKDQTSLRQTENGITIIGLRQFLTDENSLRL